ncbi:MAG: peptidoglycan-binding domain-containing protein [Chitinophagales bacterium]
MKKTGLVCVVMLLCSCIAVRAQIFINTGNPNLDKYKQDNPNAVIWQGGSEAPVPSGMKEEPKEVKKEEPKVEAKKAEPKPEMIKVQEPVKVAETPAPVNGPEGDFPPDAVPGKCYARIVVQDQYEFKEEQVVDKPATTKVEKVPAKYETVLDTIIITPATKKTVTTPAQYETVSEQQLVTPSSQKWVKQKPDVNCVSENPKDCEVWMLKEIPAVYKTVAKKVEKAPAVTTEVDVPAVTKVVPRKKMVEPARENKIEVPATYKTIMSKVLVKKGGYQGWKEVPCSQSGSAEVKDDKVARLQKALQREGYDPGPADNQMGGKTKDALVKFQQDKGLPVGNLNSETLKALGIE